MELEDPVCTSGNYATIPEPMILICNKVTFSLSDGEKPLNLFFLKNKNWTKTKMIQALEEIQTKVSDCVS